MWKDSIRNIVVIFQPNILRTVGFYVRHSAIIVSISCNNFLVWVILGIHTKCRTVSADSKKDTNNLPYQFGELSKLTRSL